MAINNHKKGQPWLTQFPRRSDGGWENTNIRNQLHFAAFALDEALFWSTDGFDPDALNYMMMEAMSRLQEASDMLADRYRIDRNVSKAGYIKAKKDSFIEPAAFLEPESED